MPPTRKGDTLLARFLKRSLVLTLAATALLATSLSARAGAIAVVIGISGSPAANAGSTGNSFDVTLTNPDPSAVTIGSFAFTISTINSNVTFTSATISTAAAPYIFDGLGLFGPTISTSSGASLAASDTFSVIGSGTTIGSGATVGLGHVFFNVAAGAPTSNVALTFSAFPTTSLSSPTGAIVSFTLNNGTLHITGTNPLPLPSSLWAGATLLLGLAAWAKTKTKLTPAIHRP